MQDLPFHPKPGDILVCDYNKGFRPPEMVKRRLCVVISPKLKRRDNLVTVLPLSQTEPKPTQDWHHEIFLHSQSWGDGTRWIKCDMLFTAAYNRLARPHYRHPVTNSRLFERLSLSMEHLDEVRRKVQIALGL
jgi:uncharacterized protein YifN (PemK superfamily)